jgi:hypothetical protein
MLVHFGTVGDEAGLDLERSWDGNMEEEIWPYGTAEALVLTGTEWTSVKTEQWGMWFMQLPVITAANSQTPWISV